MLWGEAKITSKNSLKADKKTNVDHSMQELVSQRELPLDPVIFKMLC